MRRKRNALTYATLPALFTGICDAIRLKEGTTASINHQDIPAKITALPSGGDVFQFYSESVICDDSITVSKAGKLYCMSYETNITNSFGIIKNSGSKTQGTALYNSGNVWCRYFAIDVVAGDTIRFKSDNVYPGHGSKLYVVACVVPN